MRHFYKLIGLSIYEAFLYMISYPADNRKHIFPRSNQRASVIRMFTAAVLVFFLVFGTIAQPVQAAISLEEPAPSDKNRLTAYIASTLVSRHGLCVLLESSDSSGNKKYGMVDTGNANSSAARAFLKKHNVKTLEFLILTHMHKDHDGNAAWIINNYNVKKLYVKQFDSTWSDGDQATYEKVLRAAVLSPNVKQIVGVGYSLSISKSASPKASSGFVSFLKSHSKDKWKFKGLFSSSNTALYLGQASLRLFNWEIWAENGTSQWVPGKTTRCKAQKYSGNRSDNHFSMGVRVTQGSHKLWIGGDMTNLRLSKMRHAPYSGDEDRLARKIGKVDVSILNHHGRGGSNATSFLKVLSPKYVVYTSTRSEILSNGATLAATTWNYIRFNLRIPEDRIIWAYDYWGTHRTDASITLSSKGKTTTKTTEDNSSATKGLVVSLLPGKTYSNYDLTGDGKADLVTVTAAKAGSTYKGLTINVNKKAAWSTKASFKDTNPVSLVRLPGRQPYVCIAILSPTGTGASGKALGLYQYGKKDAAGKQYGLIQIYNCLKTMPVNKYSYRVSPSISCSAKRITLVTSGSDTLSSSAFVTFALEQDRAGLKNVSKVFPYTTVKGKTGTITLKAATNLFASLDAETNSSTLPKGSKVTVNGVCRNKNGATRYRIVDSNQRVWWINAPAAAN